MKEINNKNVIKKQVEKFENKDHRETVKEYARIRKRVDKVKPRTIERDLEALRALSRFLGDKPFIEATQKDMMDFEEHLETDYVGLSKNSVKGLAESSILKHESSIKLFYKFLNDKKEYKKGKRFRDNISYPDCVSWMSVSGLTKITSKSPLDKIMTEDELLSLLNAANCDRDKAAISVLYDSGLRLSEFCALNIGSVGFDKMGGYLILPKDGENLKTGTRIVRLFLIPSSTKYLRDFINNHPYKKYDYAPLFYNFFHSKVKKINEIIRKRTPTKDDFEIIRMNNNGFESRLRTIVDRAGLTDITPHTLRHNSATICAKKGFNEMELRIRYGWSPTSKMPSRYVHLASKDLDDKIKQITGFKEPEKPEKSKLVPKICWNCEEKNVPTNTFCSQCGTKLDRKPEDAIPMKDLMGEVNEMMNSEKFAILVALLKARQQEEKKNTSEKKAKSFKAEECGIGEGTSLEKLVELNYAIQQQQKK